MKLTIYYIIEKLKFPKFCVSVYTSAGDKIVMNFTEKMFEEEYGSVLSFFEELQEKGITSVLIEERVISGNSTQIVSGKRPYDIEFAEETKETQNASFLPTPMPLAPPSPQGLAGFGLGMPEIIDLHVSKNEKIRLEEENKYLKETNERLKKEVEELKEERLKGKYDESKAKGNNELFGSLLGSLPQLLAMFKGNGNTGGLAGADPQISPAKMALIEQIANPNLSDEEVGQMLTKLEAN